MHVACRNCVLQATCYDMEEVLEAYKEVEKMRCSEILITNATIYTPFQEIQNGSLHIKDGKVMSVSEAGASGNHSAEVFVFDASGLIVVPGFVDIHVHGGGGHEVMDASPEGLDRIAQVHASGGTTSMLGSTWAAPHERLMEAARALSSIMETGTKGARFLGMHVEGPYISIAKRGAQNIEYIRFPDFEEFVGVCDASSGNVKRITLAPELAGALEFVEKAVNMGIEVSIGHTCGTYEDALCAIDAGATSVTHLFNGMKSMHHREPGVIGAALVSDLKIEVIADGVHLHPGILNLVARTKAKDTILVTDAIRATCMPDGEYDGGGQRISVKDGVARLAEGNLAGSTLTMNKAVRNMVAFSGVDIMHALQMATANPAALLGIDDSIGSLEPGKLADVVVMDKEYSVRLTIVEGNVVYRASEE